MQHNPVILRARLILKTSLIFFALSLSVSAQIQFDQWRTLVFTPAEVADDSVSGALADPDFDGLKNLQEYAFNGLPKLSNPFTNPSVSTNADHLTLTFSRPKSTPDLTYVAEVSSDLVTWSSGSDFTQQIATFDRGDYETIVIQDNLSLTNETKRFMRMRINRQVADTGLIVWLDAGSNVTKDGSNKVSSWGDGSGASHPATSSSSGTSPVWTDNVINNRPVLRFDGINDQLTTATQLTSDNFTLFAVVKASATHQVDTEATTGTAGNSGQKYLFGAKSWSTEAGAGLSLGTNGITAYEQATSYMPPLAVYSGTVGTGASLVTLKYEGKKPTLYLNGLLARVGLTSPQSKVWSPSEVGAGDFGAFQGDVAEIMLYNRTLSSDELAIVDTYLSKKYGLQINPIVAITGPSSDVSFGTERVDVQGTITHLLPLASLDVNGVHAFINGTTFTVRNVPVQSGLNVLTAIAKDVSGHTGAMSINLNVAPAVTPIDPVVLATSTNSGFGPLTVQFDTTVNVPGTIVAVWYDFDGDGVVDQTASTLGTVSHTYSTEGSYLPVVTIVTTLGTYSSVGGFYSADETPIIVQPAPVLTVTMTSIAKPFDLKATADGSLYVLSQDSATVTQFDASGTAVRASAALGGAPTGLDVDSSGKVYVALRTLNQVVRLIPSGTTFAIDSNFNTTGKIGRSDAAAGSADGEFNQPYDVAVGDDGVYVTDTGNNRIQIFQIDGTFKESFGAYGAALGQFSAPQGILYSKTGLLYVSDSGNNRIVTVSSNDAISSVSGTVVGANSGEIPNLSADTENLYLINATSSKISAVQVSVANSNTPTALWSIGSTYGLLHPHSATVSLSNVSQVLLVADTDNNRIVKIVITPQTPMAVWADFKTKLASGNVDGALANCQADEATAFRDIISKVGATVFYAWITDAGTVNPISISDSEAQYQFGYVVDGVSASFFVTFVKENGQWKISEM